jgi:hypothetical protein
MAAVDAKARLKEIIDSYLEKDGGASIDTGVVASHLAQMKLFGIRQGVEFFLRKIILAISEKILLSA